jgi:hypothetical protein
MEKEDIKSKTPQIVGDFVLNINQFRQLLDKPH